MEILFILSGILLIHVFAWMTPWPLSILIIQNSLEYWRKTWLWTAVWIACWNFIHISYAIIAILIAKNLPNIVMKIIGLLWVIYLLYLWIKVLKSKIQKQTIDSKKKIQELPILKSFKDWLIINLLSPAASLFFASIIASISTSNDSILLMIILLIMLPINSFLLAYTLSIFFTQKKIRKKYLENHATINKILGSLLIVFALLLFIKQF